MSHYKLWIACLAVILFGTLALFYKSKNEGESSSPSASTLVPTAYAIDPTPSAPKIERIGMNLSFWTSWGAEQYQNNILMNPGFEGEVDRIIVVVNHADDHSFSDGRGLGQKDDYWNGASFEIRSGLSAGTTGTISKSLNLGEHQLPQYFTDGPAPFLVADDVIVLTKSNTSNPVQQWWIPEASQSLVSLDNTSVHPHSSGSHSVALTPSESTPAEINSYLDAITDRAGNLLTLSGPWKFSSWIRGEGDSPQLTASFQRMNGTDPFFSETFQAPNEWKQVAFLFNPTDSSTPGTLKFGMSNQTPGTRIFVDDVFLGPVNTTNPHTSWREEVVDMLKTIRPSYLRDWQGQLGDTFQNRTADIYGRKNWILRLYGGEGTPAFGYSIPDFLDLCTQVQAAPWIIIPPTLTDAELTLFGLFLSDHANTSQFPTVILEFGNENWNWLFRSTGIPIAAAHGPVADRAFEFIKLYAGPDVNIRRVINGQFYDPKLTKEFVSHANNYDTLAVAPYFFTTMDEGSSNTANLAALFKDDNALFKAINDQLKPLGKTMALYEVNLHTMSGKDSADSRNPFVTGAVGGTALAKRLIEGMFNNASPQLVFCFAQYDSHPFEVPGYVGLWGICRDCSTTKRLRPTGLAVIMLNKVAAGSLHKVTAKDADADSITLAAFRTADEWNAAAINSNATPQRIELHFPDDGRELPTYANVLEAASPFDSNEDVERVKIVKKPIEVSERTIQFIIPAYGFCTLTSDRIEQAAQNLPSNQPDHFEGIAEYVLPQEL